MIQVRQPPDTAATATAPTSLLEAGYQRLITVCSALRVRVVASGSRPAEGRVSAEGASAEGRVSAAELAADPELLTAFIDAEADRILHDHGQVARHDVAASRALHAYLWSVSLLMSGTWYREQRVPRIRPQDVRIDLATGALDVVVSGAFSCLPDDPACALPGVRVLAHEEALRAELRAAVADHVRPLLAALGPHIRRGPRALWGMVGDDLISGVWYVGRMLGEEERALGMAEALLPAAIPPFPAGADFRRLAAADGRSYPTRTRSGCCLYYTIRPAEACLTCPRTGDAERLRRLTEEAP